MAKTEKEIETLEWLDEYYLQRLEYERLINDLFPGLVEANEEEN